MSTKMPKVPYFYNSKPTIVRANIQNLALKGLQSVQILHMVAEMYFINYVIISNHNLEKHQYTLDQI